MARYDIIQEKYADDPWKVLVCCILLNQTSNTQVRPLIEDFFIKWPNPFYVSLEKKETISNFIRTTGFQNIKAGRILKFSKEWIEGGRDPKKFTGIGEYGREAWRIFVDRDTNFSPKDKKLKMYVDSL